MGGTTCITELAQLAHLLRTCAEAAKSIAWSIPRHARVLFAVATGADRLAEIVERIEA